MKEILIKVRIGETVERELYPYFEKMPARKRAEMARRLMVDGLRCKNQSTNQTLLAPHQPVISHHDDNQTDAELLDKDSEMSELFSL